MTVVIPTKAQDYTKHRQRMPIAKTANDGRYPSQGAGLHQAVPITKTANDDRYPNQSAGLHQAVPITSAGNDGR